MRPRNNQQKPAEQPKLTPCRFAGDPNDEYCKKCNGVEMDVEGAKVPANQCGGYEVPVESGAPVQEEPPVSQEDLVEFTGTHCSICECEQFNTDSGVSCKNGHGGASSLEELAEASKAAKATHNPQQANAANISENPDTYVPQAYATVIKAESGVSVELKDRSGVSRWYKFTYSEERTIPNTCTVDMEEEKRALWNDVNATVDGQVEETLSFLQSK